MIVKKKKKKTEIFNWVILFHDKVLSHLKTLIPVGKAIIIVC